MADTAAQQTCAAAHVTELESENVLARIERVVSQRGTEEFCSWLNSRGKVAGKLTFVELWQKAGAVAFMLRKRLNLQQGQCVVLLYSPGLDFLSAFFGCLRAGVVAIPLYPPVPSNLKTGLQRIQRIISQTDAAAVLCDSAVRQLYSMDRVNMFSSTRSLWGSISYVSTSSVNVSHHYAEHSIAPDDLAFLQFSSGSTGNPKGVMISFRALSHNVQHIHLAYVKRLGLGEHFHERERERGVSWLPHYHDMGLVVGLVRPLAFGCRMTYFSPLLFMQKPHLWIQTLSRTKAHVTSSPNFGLRLAARKWNHGKHAGSGVDLSSLVFVQCAAEPIQPRAVEEFWAALSQYGLRRNCLAASYGLAESVVMVCADLSGSVALSAARPLLVRCGFDHHSDFDIRIVNPETREEEPEGVEGEVWVSSSSTAMGYWRDAELSGEVFGAQLAGTEVSAHAGRKFLRTGDLGFMEGGGLFISGRMKDLIIVRGMNIYPQDVEAEAEGSSELVRPGCSAAVEARTGQAGGEHELVVVVEVRAEAKAAMLQGVCDRVARGVAAHCGVWPARVVAIHEKTIPKTTSGKIRRKQTALDLADGKLRVRFDLRVAGADQPHSPQADVVLAPQREAATGGDPRVLEASEEEEEDGSESEAVEDEREEGGSDAAAGAGAEGSGVSEAEIREVVLRLVRECEGLEHVDADSRLMEEGLDSVTCALLSDSIGDALGCELEPTVLIQCPSVRALAHHLARTEFQLREGAGEASPRAALPGPAGVQASIGIVGMACRLPGGVNDLRALARAQAQRRSACGAAPWERWDRWAVAAELRRGRGCSEEVAERLWRGSFVTGSCFEAFDPAWFRMTAVEAASMDPQQRALLVVAAEALLDAGYCPEDLPHQRIGVFVGCSGVTLFATLGNEARAALNSFLDYADGPQALQGTRSALAATSGRISHTLGLHGPSVTVDTACSSSLVAVDVAKRYLVAGDCDTAVVCSVNQLLSPAVALALAEARMTSPDGVCKSFDAAADGYGRGEGCCAIVLRRVETEDDATYAFLRGSAVGHDGESTSLVAPNGSAQREVIERALLDAKVAGKDVQYLEAHGTGTALGDPVEVAAAAAVFAPGRDEGQPLLVNSVKANVGHLEACAGLAGIFSAVAALGTGVVPPNAQLRCLNPRIAELSPSGALQFPTSAMPLPQPEGALASCSSFGFTGTLAHVVLQAPPAERRRDLAAPLHAVAWLLSGQDQAAVPPPSLLREEAYAAALEDADQEVRRWLGRSILDLEHRAGSSTEEGDAALLAQPAHFAMQVALARRWLAGGHAPQVLLGHSLGELAGLCVAGAFSLHTGLRLVCARARALRAAPTTRGRMVAVRAALEVVTAALERAGQAGAAVAAINSPEQVVVSGPEEAVAAVTKALPAGTLHRSLPSEFAYHSPAMQGAVAEYQAAIRECLPSFQPTSIPVISTVTGAEWSAGDPVQYLTHHLLGAVHFQPAVETALRCGITHFVEIGPKRQLEKMLQSIAAALRPPRVVCCHHGTKCSERELQAWMETLRQQRLPCKPKRFALSRLQHRLLQSSTVHASGSPKHFRGWLHANIQSSWLGSLASPRPFPAGAQLEGLLAAAAKSCADSPNLHLHLRGLTLGSAKAESEDDRLEVEVAHNSSIRMFLTRSGGKRDSIGQASAFDNANAATNSWCEREREHAAAVQRSEEWSPELRREGSQDPASAVALRTMRRFSDGAATSVVAQLVAPLAVLDETDGGVGYMVHPMMLDETLRVVASLFGMRSTSTPTPSSRIDSVSFKMSGDSVFEFPTELTVYARSSGDGRACEVCSVADPDGSLLLTLEGLVMSLDDGRRPCLSGVLSLEKQWISMYGAASSARPTYELGGILVVGDVSLPEEFQVQLLQVHRVPALKDCFAASGLRDDFKKLETIIVGCGAGDCSDGTTFLQQVLMLFSRTLGGQHTVILVTHASVTDHSMQEMLPGGETVPRASGAPYESLLWGAARAARGEGGDCCRVVSIDADGAAEWSPACARALGDYLRCVQLHGPEKTVDCEFLHRCGELRVGRFHRIRQAAFQRQGPSGMNNGCYVVTGGTGRLGLMAARALVETKRAGSVVLLSRSCREDARGSSDLEWLKQQRGLELRVMACDVGDDNAVAQTLEAIRRSGNRIRGVVHAAGVLRLGRIVGDEACSGVEETLQGHASGAWHLHRHTLGDDLELFVMLSSVASAISVFGCSVYAAAKAFQDELVQRRRRCGLPGYSVQLPWVGGVGVADGIKVPSIFQSPATQLTPQACAELFCSRLGPQTAQGSLPGVELCLPPDLLEAMQTVLPPACLVQFDLLRDQEQSSPHPAPPPANSRTHESAPGKVANSANKPRNETSATHDKLAALRDELAQPDLGLDDCLLDAGLDSLSAVAVVARLRSAGCGSVGIPDVLSRRTIRQLLEQHSAPGSLPPRQPGISTDDVDASPDRQAVLAGAGELAALAGVPIPASWQQEQMVVVQAADPASCAYNEALLWSARRGLRVPLLAEAVSLLQLRFDALRTSFLHCEAPSASAAGMFVMQLVAPAGEVPVPFERMQAAGAEEAGLLLSAAVLEPFDVMRGPLFRVRVCELRHSEEVQAALVFHHSVVDGWSVALLLQELALCYRALLNAQDPLSTLPPAPLQYSDYAVWQRAQLLQPSALQRLQRYWRQALPRTPILLVPTDFPRPHAPRGVQGRALFSVGPQLAATLRGVGAREGCTLFHVLLGAYALLLGGLSGATEVLVGVPCANRAAASGLDRIVGDFVNSIPILVACAGDTASFLGAVRESVVRGTAHAELPFPRIAEAVGATRRAGHSTLVQTSFSLLARGSHDMRKGAGFALDGVELDVLDLEVHRDAKFELEVELTEADDGGLRGFLGFMLALYQPDTAAGFAAKYLALLQQLAAASSSVDVAGVYAAVALTQAQPPDAGRSVHAATTAVESSTVIGARPTVATSLSISHEALEKVNQLCVEREAALSHGLLAAYGLLICRSFNIARVSVEFEVQREHSFPVRKVAVLVEADDTFTAVLERVSAQVRAATEGDLLAVGDGAARSAKPSEAEDSAVFLLREGGGAEIMLHPTEHGRLLSLELQLSDDGGGVRAQGRLRGPLSETVLRFGERFGEWLKQVAADPSAAVRRLPILAQRDREDVERLSQHRAPDFEIPFANAVAMFEASVAKFGSDVALVTPASTFTYADLDLYAARLAAALVRHGVQRGHIVGLYLERTAAMIVGILGILRVGAAYVPLNPDHPQNRIAELVSDAGMHAIVLVKSHRTQWAVDGDVPTVVVAEDGSVARSELRHHRPPQSATETGLVWQEPQPTPSAQRIASSDLMYIYYTSGSTGRPKGVKLPHSAVLHFTYAIKGTLKLQHSDRVLIGSCFTFDCFVGQMWPSIEVGASMVLAGMTEMLMDVPRLVAAYKCTWTLMTPTVLAAQSPAQLKKAGLQMAMAVGEKVTLALQNSYCEHLRFVQGYGPTEAAVTVTTYECVRNPAFPRKIGSPYTGLRFYVVDTVIGVLQPVGIPGELYLAGPQLAHGYHNRPEETARAFCPNPFLREDDTEDARRVFATVYKTGDLCQWLPDGSLEYLDRCDSEMKVNGVRIVPAEIESRLLEVSGVKDAAVVHWQQKVLAAYVAPASADPNACRAHLARVLPAGMCPSVVVPVAEFKTSAAGKKDLKLLPDPSSAAINRLPATQSRRLLPHGESAEARDDREGTILSKLSSLALDAGAAAMEADTQWIEAGLTSMGMIRMLGALQREVGGLLARGDAELDLRSTAVFFEYPTLGSLARKISQLTPQRAREEEPYIVLAQEPHAGLELESLPWSSQLRHLPGTVRRQAIRAKLQSLAKDLGAREMDEESQWMEAGLTSTGMTKMLDALAKDLGDSKVDLRSSAMLLDFPTLGAMVDRIAAAFETPAVPVPVAQAKEVSLTIDEDDENAGAPGPWIRSGEARDQSRGSASAGARWRVLRQSIVLLSVLGVIVVAAVPSILLVERLFDRTSAWWLAQGRAGPMLMAVVPVWMCSYTLLCIAAKWVLVGRYHEGYVVMWSNAFTAWMIVERLWSVWELSCGRFLASTPWLNAVYAALGARISWSARLDMFVREWDLISIGGGAKVKGKVFGRIFDRGGVHFRPVCIGCDARVDAMAVVQPGSKLDDNAVVESSALVPQGSHLTAEQPWHGSPCRRQRAAGTQRDDAGDDAAPFFLTRLLFPLIFLALVVPIASLCNRLLPGSNVDTSAWSLSSLSRSLMYVALFLCTGAGMFAATVAIKWSCLSPYLTDTIANVVFSTFFQYVDKTLLITWWHRAFGLAVGRNSFVTMHDFCRPSAAHLIQIGERCSVVRCTANPSDPPTLWSWMRGRSGHPWRCARDIVLKNDVMLYLQARLEAGVVLNDEAQVMPSTRLQARAVLEAGATAVGDPCTVLRAGARNDAAARLRMPISLTMLHYVTFVAHLAVVVAVVVVGLECMQSIEWGGGATVAVVLCRIAFFIAWLLVVLGMEVCAVKWLATGRAQVGQSSIYERTDVLFTSHMDTIQKWYAALCGGLFVMDMLLVAMGFSLRVGRVFISTGTFIAQDADVVTIEDGAVLDEFSFVLAHAAARDQVVVAECRVGSEAVLHPFAGLVMGSMGERSALMPKSRCFGQVRIGAHEVWIGSPARPTPPLPTSCDQA